MLGWIAFTAVVVFLGAAVLGRAVIRGRRELGTAEQRANFQTLHAATLAAPSLRHGLTERARSARLGICGRC